MKESSEFEILKVFAKSKGIPYYTSSERKDNIFVSSERYMSTKYVVFDLDKYSFGVFFIFYDSYSSKIAMTTTYCGLFKEIPDCSDNIKIVRRDWFDALSFKKRYISGNKYTDRNVTIFSEYNRVNPSLLKDKTIRGFVELSDLIKPVNMEIEMEANSLVNKLNEKNLLSIKLNRWLLDTTELELFISKGLTLINNIQ